MLIYGLHSIPLLTELALLDCPLSPLSVVSGVRKIGLSGAFDTGGEVVISPFTGLSFRVAESDFTPIYTQLLNNLFHLGQFKGLPLDQSLLSTLGNGYSSQYLNSFCGSFVRLIDAQCDSSRMDLKLGFFL